MVREWARYASYWNALLFVLFTYCLRVCLQMMPNHVLFVYFIYLLFTYLFTDDAEPHRGRGVDGHLPGRVVREQQLPAQTSAQTQDQQGAWSRQTDRRRAARVRIHGY